MGMVVASGRVLPQELQKTPRRQGRKPPCPFHRQVPGEEACPPKEDHHPGRKLGQVHLRPLVGLSLGSCDAKVFEFTTSIQPLFS